MNLIRKLFMNNSIENQIARLEHELTALKQLINKPKAKWQPNPNDSKLILTTLHRHQGFFYPTDESASKAAEDIINYARMRKFAHERNGNWAPDWQNAKEIKHYVVFNPTYNKWFAQLASAIKTANAVYFKSESDAQELADLLNNDQF